MSQASQCYAVVNRKSVDFKLGENFLTNIRNIIAKSHPAEIETAEMLSPALNWRNTGQCSLLTEVI